MSADPVETMGQGNSVEIQIPVGKETVFAEKIAKIDRMVGDLTGGNDSFKNLRIDEIRKAERSTVRKNILLDVREFAPTRQQVAYVTPDGRRTERAVIYFQRGKADMTFEYAVDENGTKLALDTALYDASPESGVYEARDKKQKARVYPVFGENLAIERTITIFENDLEYREEAVATGSEVVSPPVGEVAAEPKPEEDVLTRDEALIRRNPELVTWFYQTCQVLVSEKNLVERKRKYDEARGKLEGGGMPKEVLDLITGSSEVILSEAELDASKSTDKAGELKEGMAGLASAFGDFDKVFKEREDFLRLRIMVAESGKELKTGDINFLNQLKGDLETLKRIRLKKSS